MPDITLETTPNQSTPNQSAPDQNTPPNAPAPVAEKPKPPKTSKTKLIIIIVAALVALVLIGTIGFFLGKGSNNNLPSKENTATKSSSTSKADSEISLALSSIKLDSNFENSKTEYEKYWNSTTPSARPATKPDFLSQNKLLLTVAFTNNSDSASASITPIALRLKDSYDKQYPPEFQTDAKDYTFSINSGETTKIDVYFTVPSSQTHFKLIYQSLSINVTSP